MIDSNTAAHRRIVAAGSGREGIAEPEVCQAILELARVATPAVLYLGTATYDRPGSRAAQTGRLEALGCDVDALSVADATPSRSEMEDAVGRADVILASGGNTLFAVDRWRRLGLDGLLRDALRRGAVLCGGSAGAICWFDGGHSDSMNPSSFKSYVLAEHPPEIDERAAAAWDYIRVPGLGILPGLCCPHYDRTQSNGVPRSVDFRAMMLRHDDEIGIAIDHFAALVVDGEDYRVVSPEGRSGSSGQRPVVQHLSVVDGRVESSVLPNSGKVDQLLGPAARIVEDPRLAAARAANPDDLP